MNWQNGIGSNEFILLDDKGNQQAVIFWCPEKRSWKAYLGPEGSTEPKDWYFPSVQHKNNLLLSNKEGMEESRKNAVHAVESVIT